MSLNRLSIYVNMFVFPLCSSLRRFARSSTVTWTWWTGTNRWWRPRTPPTLPLHSLRFRTAAQSQHLWWSESFFIWSNLLKHHNFLFIYLLRFRLDLLFTRVGQYWSFSYHSLTLRKYCCIGIMGLWGIFWKSLECLRLSFHSSL